MKLHIIMKVHHALAGLYQNSTKLTNEWLLEVASAMDHSVRMLRETYALNEHTHAARFHSITERVTRENNFTEALLKDKEDLYCDSWKSLV